MNENILLKIALICSILGIIAIYFVSVSMDVPEYVPSSISLEGGKEIKLTGKITKISANENIVFLEILNENSVTVVVFDNISVEKGDLVELFGTVQEYKGKEEIIADKIRVIEDVS